MSKGIIRFLIGFGFLLFFIGLTFKKTPVLIIGLLMTGAGFYFGLGPDGILRKDQVQDNWSNLLGGAQEKAEEIFQNTEQFIKESKAPDIRMERKEIAPGLIKGLTGKTRNFLVITDQRNFKLAPYQVYINARDYGENLDVSWHLTYKSTLWQSLLSLIPFVNVIPATLSELDLFDQQDLRVYVTNAHHCLLRAVDKLMSDLGQDSSKIDRKSRGFLGIS